MLAQAGDGLKLVANYGRGGGSASTWPLARQRGILVSNTPGVMTDDTADMAMALILAVLRRLPEGNGGDAGGALGRLGANGLHGRSRGRASGWASWGWGASGRRWGAGGPRPSGMQGCITTTVAGCMPISRGRWRRTYWDSLDQMISRMDVISSTPRTRPRPST